MVAWVAVGVGGVITLPFAIVRQLPDFPAISTSLAGWGFVIASGFLHTFYFILLALAYQKEEISIVYPIARGSGIGLTAFLGWILLDEAISLLAASGIALVFLGILSMGLGEQKWKKSPRGIQLAFLVGFTIVAYSLVDKMGVSHLDPVFYLSFLLLISALPMGLFVGWHNPERILATVRENILTIFLIGVGIAGTYLIILFAFTMGTVGTIVAVREFAVVIGAVLGIVFLKERLTLAKGIAITVITIGLLCIKAG